MKNTFLLIALFSVVAVACSKKQAEKTTTTKVEKETTVVKKDKPTEASNTPQTTAKGSNTEGVDVNLIAKIKRTPCFGKCPVFTVELFNNGLVKYNGIAFVERKGNFTAKASPEFIKQIQDKALAIKYLSFENKYPISPVAIADLPTTTTYIRIGEASKQILDNFDAPRELIDFENWLEKEFNKLEWKAAGE